MKPGARGRPQQQGGQLRIIGGQHKARKLEVPAGKDVRPTSDRVRESLFNILDHLVMTDRDGSPLRGARVLDRFAGTGALGLEALSRGANEVWLVERSLTVQRMIKRNFGTVTGQDILPPGIRIGDEGLLGLGNASLRRPFDIIFCDPPYGFADWEALVDGFEVANLVTKGTLLVTETDGKDSFPDLSQRWETLKDRAIGRTRVQVLVHI